MSNQQKSTDNPTMICDVPLWAPVWRRDCYRGRLGSPGGIATFSRSDAQNKWCHRPSQVPDTGFSPSCYWRFDIKLHFWPSRFAPVFSAFSFTGRIGGESRGCWIASRPRMHAISMSPRTLFSIVGPTLRLHEMQPPKVRRPGWPMQVRKFFKAAAGWHCRRALAEPVAPKHR